MRHVRVLFESRPIRSRVPDQPLIADDLDGAARIQAARGDGYAFIYSAKGRPFVAILGKVSGDRLRALWFDPRSGSSRAAGEFANRGTQTFTPKSSGRGNDWVLILDDVAKRFPIPGVPSDAPWFAPGP